jgi:hypothetical protein
MANDKKFVAKNGLQTQNILFKDSAGGVHNITIQLIDSDVLLFEGDAGQLFSLSDTMDGVIYSVNDISGIPSIEVDADGIIRLAEFTGNVLVGTDSDDGSKFQITGSLRGDSATFDGPLVTSGDILPNVDNTGNLGTALKTWNQGYFTNMVVDGTLTVRTAIDLADNDTIRFGTSDDFWMAFNGTDALMELEGGVTNFKITDNGTDRFTFAKSTGILTATSFNGALTGNASTASAWATGRTITLTGDVTGTSAAWTGSGNISFAAAVGNDTHTHGAGNLTGTTLAAVVTASSLTSLGSLTSMTLGGHTMNDIDITSEYSGADDHLMTSAAINARILDFNYTTTSGTVTSVGASGTIQGLTLSGGPITSTGTITLGGSITNMNASNIDTGTIPGARGVSSGSTTSSFVEYNGTVAAAGQFNGGTATPTGSTRLNYSGYFYPTYINLTGSGNTTTAATHYFMEQSGDGYVRPKTLADVKSEIVTSSAVIAGLTFTPYNATNPNSYTSFAETEARSAISVTDTGGEGSLAYNSGSGVITYTGPLPSIGSFPLVVTATGIAMSQSNHYHVSDSAQTMTLPSADSADRIEVSVRGFTNTIVARNGNKIMGLAEDITINVAYSSLTFEFIDSDYGWFVSDTRGDVTIVNSYNGLMDSAQLPSIDINNDTHSILDSARLPSLNLAAGVDTHGDLPLGSRTSGNYVQQGGTGNGLTGSVNSEGGTFTVTMGTPGTLTGATSNGTTAGSHTHAITTNGTGDVVGTGSPIFTGIVTAPDLTLTSLSNQVSEATAVMINGSNVIGTRELGTNAFNSTAFTTNTGTVTSVSGGTGLTSSGGTTPSISHDAHTGDVTGSTGLTIAGDAVTYAKMQNVVADDRILGNVAGAGGIVAELTAAQVRTMINVENGATADQTATEILAAIKTVDGSGTGLDADLLDGNEATAFATSGHNHTGTYALIGGDFAQDFNVNNLNVDAGIDVSGGIATRYGLNGSYAVDAGSGTAWGANIWAIGTSYDGGGVSGSTWTSTSHYGLAWRRSGTGAHASIGEGIYVHQNGSLEGGIGTAGIYSAATITAAGIITATGGNSTEWNTAHGWGDHSTAGYTGNQAAGVGLSGTTTLALDLGELTVGGTLIAGDYLIAENGGADHRQLISSIPLSIFNNNSSWTSNVGTVTSVAAGNGLNFTSITGSGSVTMGTPGTLTGSTSNGVTATSHTHAITTTGTGSIVAAVSPALTGTPTAPTAAAGINTTQIATTSYVRGEIVAAGGGTMSSFNVQSNGGTQVAVSDAEELNFISGTNTTATVTNQTNPTVRIDAVDTVYTHPVTAGNKHIPSGGSARQVLTYSAPGTAVWSSSSGSLPVTITAVGTTMAINNHYQLTDSAQTMTLPSTADSADHLELSVRDFRTTTVARNGLKIMGLSEDLTIDVNFASLSFKYVDANYGWFVAQNASSVAVVETSIFPAVADSATVPNLNISTDTHGSLPLSRTSGTLDSAQIPSIDLGTDTHGDIVDATFSGTVTETQYSLTGTAIDQANGTIQYKTLSGNTTFTEALQDGQSITLMIDDGTAYTVTWPSVTWMGTDSAAAAPALQTTGYTGVVLFQMNGTVYGSCMNPA